MSERLLTHLSDVLERIEPNGPSLRRDDGVDEHANSHQRTEKDHGPLSSDARQLDTGSGQDASSNAWRIDCDVRAIRVGERSALSDVALP